MNTPFDTGGIAPLAHLGLIRARGSDARTFLQGQLTNDVAGLGLSQARLAGFCSAKGRLQASFIVWKLADDDLLLACAASLLPATLKRLSMFVLRAKCKLTDASAELSVFGATGASAAALVGDTPAWGLRSAFGGTLIRLPDVDGVAPVWLGLAECDPLVDEGLMYADKLRAAGVAVDLEIYRGVTHEFIKMGRVIPEARQAHADAARALRQAFGQHDPSNLIPTYTPTT